MSLMISFDQLREILSQSPLPVEGMESLSVETRRLCQMEEYFPHATRPLSDAVVYEVITWPLFNQPTDLLFTVTILYPGTVGSEHFHTKGHFHTQPDGPEYVVGYQGEGWLEMGDRQGKVSTAQVGPGTLAWIPSGIAHRMVNRSIGPLTYLSVSSAAVGHDYESVTLFDWKRRPEDNVSQ